MAGGGGGAGGLGQAGKEKLFRLAHDRAEGVVLAVGGVFRTDALEFSADHPPVGMVAWEKLDNEAGFSGVNNVNPHPPADFLFYFDEVPPFHDCRG